MTTRKRSRDARDVVTLADMSPRHDVMGGSGQRVFGGSTLPSEVSEQRRDPLNQRKTRDQPPKSPTRVTGTVG